MSEAVKYTIEIDTGSADQDLKNLNEIMTKTLGNGSDSASKLTGELGKMASDAQKIIDKATKDADYAINKATYAQKELTAATLKANTEINKAAYASSQAQKAVALATTESGKKAAQQKLALAKAEEQAVKVTHKAAMDAAKANLATAKSAEHLAVATANATSKSAKTAIKAMEDTAASSKKNIQSSIDALAGTSPVLSGILNVLKNPMVGAAVLAAGAIMGVAKAMSAAAERNTELEEMRVKLQTVAVSAGDAVGIMNALAESPISAANSFDDLVVAAQKMTTLGMSADATIESLEMIGNISMGDPGKLDALATSFAKVSTQGKVTTRDVLAMTNAGFNPLAEIARTTGQTLRSLEKDLDDGKISAEQLAGAFKTATSEGGRFENAALKLSLTINGLNGTISDNMTQINANLFAPLNGFMKGFKSAFADLTGEFMKFTQPLSELGDELSKSEKLWGRVAVAGEYFGIIMGLVGDQVKFFVDLFKNQFNDMTRSLKSTGNETDFVVIAFAALATAMKVGFTASRLLWQGLDLIISGAAILGKSLLSPIQALESLGEAGVALLKGDFGGVKDAMKGIGQKVQENFTGALKDIEKRARALGETASELAPAAIKAAYEENYKKLTEAGDAAKEKARLSGEDLGRNIIDGTIGEVEEGSEKVAAVVIKNMSHLADEAAGAMKWLHESDRKSLEFLLANITSLTDEQAKQLESLLKQAENAAKLFSKSVQDLVVDSLNGSLKITTMIYDQQAKAISDANKKAVKSLEDRHKAEKKLNDAASLQIQKDFEDRLLSEYEADVAREELKRKQLEDDELFAQEKQALEDENARKSDEIARKQFNANKASALAGIAVSLGKAIMGFIAGYSAMGPFGMPMAIAQISVASGLAAVQAGIIGSQKFVGAFEDGGIVPGKGIALTGEAGVEAMISRDGKNMTLVGANGPQLVKTMGGERIFNAGDTSRIMKSMNNSGNTVNASFNINVGNRSNPKQAGMDIARIADVEIGRLIHGRR